ncbi:MAG: 4a-hydroxytetrahydrobiopterin dehydratase [bacterium]
MTATSDLPAHWKVRQKPASLEARFEFDDFATLRDFLDDIAEHAETLAHHPNISFGRSHVSLIIYAQEISLGDIDFTLAKQIEASFITHTQSKV